MKNTLIKGLPDPFTLSYLEAIERVDSIDLRFLPIGPFFPAGPWAERMHLLTGELARWPCGECGADGRCEHWAERTERSYLNIVVSPMGAQLGLPKKQSDFAPDDAKKNPDLAMQNPSAAALHTKAKANDRMAYVPETALQALYVDGQTNIAVLRPIRAKRPQLMLDFEVLKKYDLTISPTDVSERFALLGIRLLGCDPSSFGSTVESLVP